MTNSLERIFDGIIDALQSRVIPKIQDESARGQAYGALDMLRNLKPRVEWAVGPLQDDVDAGALAGASASRRYSTCRARPAAPHRRDVSPDRRGRRRPNVEPMRDRLDRVPLRGAALDGRESRRRCRPDAPTRSRRRSATSSAFGSSER